MGFDALFAVLRARLWVVLAVAAVACGAAIAIGLVLPKLYVAEARVQLDAKQKNSLTGLFEPRVRISEFLGQQAAIASSRVVAAQVFDQLIDEGFFLVEDFEERWRDETSAELIAGNDLRLWAADQLAKKLEIRADANESTLGIGFRDPDPAQAARIANAFANAFMDTVIAKRARRADRMADNFQEETELLERKMIEAQDELRAFREKHGVIGDGSNFAEDVAVELATMTQTLAEAQSDASEMRSLLQQAQLMDAASLYTLPLPRDLIAALQAQERLGLIQAELEKLQQRYDPTYPPLVEARREMTLLEQTILQSIEGRAEFARRRVASLQDSVNDLKIKVLELQSIKQTYDVLARRVSASQATFELVANRSLQEALQSRVDVVDVFMLARAVPPARSMAPPLVVLAIAGLVGGLVLGACVATAAEVYEGRVRAPQSVAHALRAPIMATIDLPDHAQMPVERRAQTRKAA